MTEVHWRLVLARGCRKLAVGVVRTGSVVVAGDQRTQVAEVEKNWARPQCMGCSCYTREQNKFGGAVADRTARVELGVSYKWMASIQTQNQDRTQGWDLERM